MRSQSSCGHLLERRVAEDAGVVDDDVDALPRVERALDDLRAVLDRVVVGDGLAARGLDLLDDLVGRGGRLAAARVAAAEVVDDDLRAARREEQRVRAAEAVAGARDDGDASSKRRSLPMICDPLRVDRAELCSSSQPAGGERGERYSRAPSRCFACEVFEEGAPTSRVPAVCGGPRRRVVRGVEKRRDASGLALKSRPLMLPLRRSSPIRLLAFLFGAAFGLEAGVARADDSAGDDPRARPEHRGGDQAGGQGTHVPEPGPRPVVRGCEQHPSTAGLGTTTTLGYAIGLEASLNHYARQKVFAFGYGAFIQTQLEDGKYFRSDIGVQGNAGPAGLELGLGNSPGASETCVPRPAPRPAASIPPCSSRSGISSSRSASRRSSSPSRRTRASRASVSRRAFTVALKLPIALQGRDPTGLAVQANGHAW